MPRKPTLYLLFALLFLGAGQLFAQGPDERIDQVKALLYSNPDSAKAICLQLLEEKSSLSTSDFLQAQRFLGILLDLKGEYEASLDAYNVILNYEITTEDSVHWANAVLGKGVIYHRLGQFDKALELNKIALS